jgi:hypothetical protein
MQLALTCFLVYLAVAGLGLIWWDSLFPDPD